jgi:hypothetical protein
MSILEPLAGVQQQKFLCAGSIALSIGAILVAIGIILGMQCSHLLPRVVSFGVFCGIGGILFAGDILLLAISIRRKRMSLEDQSDVQTQIDSGLKTEENLFKNADNAASNVTSQETRPTNNELIPETESTLELLSSLQIMAGSLTMKDSGKTLLTFKLCIELDVNQLRALPSEEILAIAVMKAIDTLELEFSHGCTFEFKLILKGGKNGQWQAAELAAHHLKKVFEMCEKIFRISGNFENDDESSCFGLDTFTYKVRREIHMLQINEQETRLMRVIENLPENWDFNKANNRFKDTLFNAAPPIVQEKKYSDGGLDVEETSISQYRYFKDLKVAA